jgi:hypothetical protein
MKVKGVKPEPFTQFANALHLVQAVHIDPSDALAVPERGQPIDILSEAFLDRFRGVIDHLDALLLLAFLSHVKEASGRRSHLFLKLFPSLQAVPDLSMLFRGHFLLCES